ncbi:MAG: galactokinase [Ferruginibacter sp.]|nr:galactokinase [Ferruginibacter sp.]
MHTIANEIKAGFIQRYGTEPRMYFSPGRINIIGEHVDYNDGFVMPAAIDKGLYYAVALNDSDRINMYSTDYDEEIDLATDEIAKSEGWKNYVLSVLNEFVKLGITIKGFNCVFGGDIPQGSGMSSSAAVEGGLAMGMNDLFNAGLDRIGLARLCQRAEHGYPGVQCGIMDQFANMMGLEDQVILLDCMDLSYEYFPLDIEGYAIVLLNSKVHHSLASSEYNTRRKQCMQGLEQISAGGALKSFRDLTVAEVKSWKDKIEEQIYKRCLYVVEEIFRTKNASVALAKKDLERLGALMFETHDGLSKLYEVSCKELDLLVNIARNDNSVLGARLMGGGFGGCTINIVEENSVNDFVEKASVMYKDQFDIELESYLVKTSKGTHILSL